MKSCRDIRFMAAARWRPI